MQSETNFPASLPKLISDYLEGSDDLVECFDFQPRLEGLKQAAASRRNFPVNRQVLVDVLSEQAESSLYVSDNVRASIDLLKHETTSTITTGHQLCLYGGPLFFIYKICSAIKWSKRLTEEGIIAVPVYWMASEDHDFEEINHLFVRGQRVSWELGAGGAVGDMYLKEVSAVHETLTELLGDDYHAAEHLAELKKMFAPERTLTEAVRDLAYYLFAAHGVVVIDAADARLKALFAPYVKQELEESFSFKAVTATTEKLESVGYHGQVTPREINLFFMESGVRERIVRQDNEYALADGSRTFSKKELFDLIDTSPEKFSPNVILRPLYQEVILPNLGYIGGPGELSYWMQLKSTFEAANAFFPAVLLRDMVAIATVKTQKRAQQLGLPFAAFSQKRDELIKQLLREKGTHEHLVTTQKDTISRHLEKLIEDLASFDPNMERSAKAEKARIENRLEVLRKKVLRSDKQQNETMIQRLDDVLAAMFPGDVPQERVDNWLNYAGLIDSIIEWVVSTPVSDGVPQVKVYQVHSVESVPQ